MSTAATNEFHAIVKLVSEYQYLRGELTDAWLFGVAILTKGGVTLEDFEEAVDWWVKAPYEVHDDLQAIRTTALKIAAKRLSAIEGHKRRKRVVKVGEDQDDQA